MNDITLNSSLVTTNANELQQKLVIKPKSSEKALAVRRRVSIGLVKPADEKYLIGEVSDKKYMVSSVVYTFPDIKQTAEARIDENGYLFFSTENAALATKDAVVRIICLVCTPLECIKSVISAHLHPTKGFIRAKDTQRLDMQFGDEIDQLNIADLYTIGDPPSSASPAPSDDEEKEKVKNNEKKQ